ncbi:MarR family transcriptional regulator [Sphingomonas colocasiae]|uniref:MarR family transcriptional regulator n=1 Tax=Sphingomonas colocasiae TaxID=1848973 RepID=A0ABS7PJA0_9SPHN|nr:MarR family transcriptional regulator [Sphingomonas colocasiae]MBY8820830.1 MarR family transcriptional regulator [Sphingomonas colocasiae]
MLVAQLQSVSAKLAQLTEIPRNEALVRAREHLNARRARARFLPVDLFGEPAWDLLLDLFIAGEENKSVSITSACIASGAPPTTALRWIGVLDERGLIAKMPDSEDGRRIYVSLTETARNAMLRWLGALDH